MHIKCLLNTVCIMYFVFHLSLTTWKVRRYLQCIISICYTSFTCSCWYNCSSRLCCANRGWWCTCGRCFGCWCCSGWQGCCRSSSCGCFCCMEWISAYVEIKTFQWLNIKSKYYIHAIDSIGMYCWFHIAKHKKKSSLYDLTRIFESEFELAR